VLALPAKTRFNPAHHMHAARTSHLRVRDSHGHHRVTFVELFFDLVFVFAITQLSHGLLEHLTPLGAIETTLLMVAVWWAWIDTAWLTNWLDPEKVAVRLLLFVLMLFGLVLSVSIPKAFADRGMSFAFAYAAMAVMRNLFMLWALKNHDANNHRNFVRITIWHLAAASLWLAGAFVDTPVRIAIWAIAVGVDSIAPIVGFHVPGLGRSTTSDWVVEGGHIAERAALFVIIALGESVLVTGATFADLKWTPETIGAFLVSFAGSVAMWAVYFNIGAERGSQTIASSDDPGRIARSGYTYIHILIVAGIIVAAVGDELVLHHPHGHTELKTAIVLLGGPAVYLLGNGWFKWLSAPYFPLSHLMGLAMFALLIPIVSIASPLILSSATTAVLIIVAVWESISLGGSRKPKNHG
jgi:low temperature requirement protein LtrA